jgi:hypothetical protein
MNFATPALITHPNHDPDPDPDPDPSEDLVTMVVAVQVNLAYVINFICSVPN